ncbi:MAG: AraC family transcriptional regulator [Bacteroidota bacterium]
MDLGTRLLFFFSALGAFNALLLGLYILSRHSAAIKYKLLLGILLLMLSVRVGVSCFYFFENILTLFIKLGLCANLILGPLLFYYVKYRVQESSTFSKKALIHFFVLVFLLVVAGFTFDFAIWDRPIRYSVHGLLTIYILASVITASRLLKSLFKAKGPTLDQSDQEIVLVLVSTILVCLGFVVSLYTSYILGPLWFSIVLYISFYIWISSGKKKQQSAMYRRKLNQNEVAKLKHKLEQIMDQQKLYRDPNLTLEKVAKTLAVSRHFLSQMLNDNLKKSYAQLINEYRIQDACQLLEKNVSFNLESIAYEVGYNSKSSFFSAFKKVKGVTPAQYRSQIEV